MINPARTSKISALDGAARARGMAALRRKGETAAPVVHHRTALSPAAADCAPFA